MLAQVGKVKTASTLGPDHEDTPFHQDIRAPIQSIHVEKKTVFRALPYPLPQNMVNFWVSRETWTEAAPKLPVPVNGKFKNLSEDYGQHQAG